MNEKPQETGAGGAQIRVEQTATEVRGKMTGVEIHQFYGEIIVRPESIEDLPPAPGEPPYKGLAYYTEDDADIFFGRERLTAKLADRLQETRFLAVVGASGSGKSSLLRAGVVPTVRQQNWAIHVLTPTADPLTSLATSLTRDDLSADTSALKRRLAADPHTLAQAAGKLAARHNRSRLLLVVDQFEEAFTLCKEEDERQAFLACLEAAAAVEGAATVLIGVRADFYDRCLQYEGLRRVLAEQQEPLGPMTEEELLRVIAEPAKRGGWQFVEGLVEQMLEDVGQEPGRLPLLSHALRETWEQRRGAVMTLAGYRLAGGVEGAIAETAENVLEKLPEEQVRLVQNVFLSLTELGEGAEDTRRIADAGELARLGDEGEVRAVLERLVRARLITVDEGQVEVAHEALIRRWPRLREWLEDNRERLRFERQLARDARDWERLERDPGALYRGARLAQAIEWWEKDKFRIGALETIFLVSARDLAEREEREKEKRRQRELEQAQKLAAEAEARREAEAERARAEEERAAEAALRAEEAEEAAGQLRRRRNVAFGLAAGALVLALVALLFYGQARSQRAEAERQTRIARARALAAQSDQAYARAAQSGAASPDLKDSLLLGWRAVNETVREGEPAVSEAYVSLYRTLVSLPDFVVILTVHPRGVWSAAFSPDGERVVAADGDGVARLWDTAPLGEAEGDGSGDLIAVLEGHTGGVRSAAFSPDGERVVTVDGDGVARLWDAQTGTVLRTLEGHADSVWSAAFSPDGERVVTAGCDEMDDYGLCEVSTARLWEAETGAMLAVLEEPTDRVQSAAFSPDGERVVTAGCDEMDDYGLCEVGTAQLWDASGDGSGDLIATLEGHTGEVWSAAFSPDGERVVTASLDGTARLWDGETGVLRGTVEGHSGAVFSAAFSPDGELVVTTGCDERDDVGRCIGGAPRLWDASGDDSGDLIATLEGHTGAVWLAAFSPDGERVVTAGCDEWDDDHDGLCRGGTARLWDGETGALLAVLEGHNNVVNSVAFSPDGERVVTASDDGTVRLWVVGIESLLAEARRQLLPMLTLEECKEYLPEDCPPDATEVPLP